MKIATDARPSDAPLPLVAGGESLGAYLRHAWRMRDFLLTLPVSTLRGQFANSVMGSLWLLINPILFSAIYFLVFGVLFNARQMIENYPAFLIIGLLTYQFSSRALAGGAKSLRSEAHLLRTVRFPRALVPLATVLTGLLTHLPAVGVMLLVVVVTGEGVHLAWLLLLPALALQTAFNLGLALVAARLGYHFRDTEYLLRHVTRVIMYLSGVMYSIGTVAEYGPDWLVWAFRINPFNAFMSIYRTALMDNAISKLAWLSATVATAAVLVGGFVYFRRREADYGDL